MELQNIFKNKNSFLKFAEGPQASFMEPWGSPDHFLGTPTWDPALRVAGVPHPGVAAGFGTEVGAADVVDLGGEAEQAAVAVGPVGLGRGLGEAVLLRGAVKHVQGPVLDVHRLLNQRGVQDQVGGS